MRKIELKTITEKTADPRTGQMVDSNFSYRENLLNALRFPQNQNGIDYAEMARVLPLIQRLQKAGDGDVVSFEDAEWQILAERVKGLRWMVAAETAFEFVTYIAECPEASALVAKKKATA